MKTLVGVVLAVVAAGSSCWAQDESHKRKEHASLPVGGAPVTEAEAQATMARVSGLFKTVLHVSVSPMRIHGNPNAAITKPEVVAEFVRLYKAMQPSFTMTPKSVPVDVTRLAISKPSEKDGLIMLVERGCVGNFGPLATGKTTTLTMDEFGDSVGFFFARIAECTHVPSTKWTPYLHG